MVTLRPMLRGKQGQSIFVEICDAATPFLPKTGLAWNSATIVMSYAKKRAARVAITPVTLAAVTTAWTSGGFKEIDATNMPGVYRLDLPDACFTDDGLSDCVIITINGVAGYAPSNFRIPLTDTEDVRTGRGGARTDS